MTDQQRHIASHNQSNAIVFMHRESLVYDGLGCWLVFLCLAAVTPVY